jgi:hypothetical protein
MQEGLVQEVVVVLVEPFDVLSAYLRDSLD